MTTSHALAFYDPLGDPEYDQLLQLWLANWRSHGWDARVVGPEWIDRHPHAHILRQATANLPTPLDRGYEQACFLRWAALPAFMSHHSIPAAFLGDFDICSLSFTPALASSLLPNSLLGGGALLVDALTANLLPAAIALTAYPSSTQPSSLLPAHANDALALKFLAARSTLLHEFTAPIIASFVPTPISPDWSPDPAFPLIHIHHFNFPFNRTAAFHHLLNPAAYPRP